MSHAAINIPFSIDEKESLDSCNELDYDVPPLDVDLSMVPDQNRPRRFSVSAEATNNAEDDYDDDDSKMNENDNNNISNDNNNSNNNNNDKYSIQNGNSHSNHENSNKNKQTKSYSYSYTRNRNKKSFIRKIYPKTKNAESRILSSVSDLFLWKGFDSNQQKLIIDAMFEKKVKKNESIITQGDRGDYFYVIESGKYQVWKSDNFKSKLKIKNNGKRALVINNEPKKVFEYDNKGSFGELALMYNAPRAATVKAITDGILWAVDRKTFRHIIVGYTAKKRARYDQFVGKLTIFDKLSKETKSQITDSLEMLVFDKNEYIIEEGSNQCQKFYLIQNGTANVIITTQDGKEQTVSVLREGDFFGERALILNDVRSASVIVTSNVLECVAIDKASFVRLLEPIEETFQIAMKSYTLKEDLNDNEDVMSDLDSD